MKNTIKKMDYEKVMALPRPKHRLPRKPNLFWCCLIRLLTIVGMMGTKFRYETEGFEKTEYSVEHDVVFSSPAVDVAYVSVAFIDWSKLHHTVFVID